MEFWLSYFTVVWSFLGFYVWRKFMVLAGAVLPKFIAPYIINEPLLWEPRLDAELI